MGWGGIFEGVHRSVLASLKKKMGMLRIRGVLIRLVGLSIVYAEALRKIRIYDVG